MSTLSLQAKEPRTSSRLIRSRELPARDVREALLEMTYLLHCTKVVKRAARTPRPDAVVTRN